MTGRESGLPAYWRIRFLGVLIDWRKWGFGGSVAVLPACIELRVWIGPARIGTVYLRGPA